MTLRSSYLLVAIGLLLGACMRPAEGRARADEAVGQADAEGIRVRVLSGRAVVRQVSPEAIVLWASAPLFDVTIERSGELPDDPSGEFPEQASLVVHNCMPGTELSPAVAVAAVVASERTPEGECRFVWEPRGQRSVTLRASPPNAAGRSPFRFAVLSDVQEAIVDVQDVFRTINEQPDLDFLLGAGDLTQQGTHSQLRRFQRELRQLDVPYYTTLGNHELGNYPSLYQHYFGRGSQSFEYRGVRFTLLDSASSTIDPIVFGWLDGWLELGRGRPHVVAMHVPPLDPVGVRNGSFGNRNEAAKLLARLAAAGVDLTLYGHIHSYYHFDNAGIPAHVSGGGGAIPERFDDIGRHFLVVRVDPLASTFDVSVVRVD